MRTDELRIDPTGPDGGRGPSRPGGGENGSSTSPGADRFWGEFSRTRAGRSNPGGSGNGSGRERSEGGTECLEWCPICRSADLIRSTASPDLRGQLESIQNEAFNVMRAFMAAYAEKSTAEESGRERPRTGGAAGEERVDIPID